MIKVVIRFAIIIVLIMGFSMDSLKKRICIVKNLDIDLSLSELNQMIDLMKKDSSEAAIDETINNFYIRVRQQCLTSNNG